MRLLFLGDIMGRSGRKAISERLNRLREKWRLDFVVVNGENATGGMGLSASHAKALIDSGVDCITLGDHAFDQKDMLTFCEQEPRIIRPLNFAKTAPGKGAPMGGLADAVIVDFHAEATSEKVAMGHWLDGRASLVVGTHTHIPTADTQILPKGTAHQSDAGMCGDYNSIIGMQKDEPLRRFITGMNKERFTPAVDEATLCGVFVETDDTNGLAKNVVQVRNGGRLQQSEPT